LNLFLKTSILLLKKFFFYLLLYRPFYTEIKRDLVYFEIIYKVFGKLKRKFHGGLVIGWRVWESYIHWVIYLLIWLGYLGREFKYLFGLWRFWNIY
jgi:hypothetical protein